MKMTPHSEQLKPENYQINAKICRLVEKFPCMYDRSHHHYLKKDVVDKAWLKISKEMDDSVPSCKERWRNIRTSFARSINVNKIPASANRTKPYYLHEELQFLARHITPGIPIPRRSNAYSSAGEESEVIEVSVGEDTFDGFASLAQDEDEDEAQQEQDSSVADSNEDIKVEQQLDAVAEAAAACPIKKRRRTAEAEQPPHSPVEQKFTQHIGAHESDFDSLFLQGLLPEMKAMDFRQKILFKRRIYEVIGDIFENSPSSTTPASVAVAVAAAAPSVATHSHTAKVSSPPSNCTASSANYVGTAVGTGTNAAPTMTVVNAADLAMIRRLNSLLQQSPPGGAPNSMLTAMVAAPKHVCASISSTVRCPVPATATVAVNRGALTRSTANMLRVTMVNPPAAAAAPMTASTAPQANIIKQEPEVLDD